MSAIRIIVTKDGPYRVEGPVKISRMTITRQGTSYVWTDHGEIPHADPCFLCRCGRSKNAPFCDGAHAKGLLKFSGTEHAGHFRYEDRADELKGPGIDLLDDSRCAFARFCHRDGGQTVWQLTENSAYPAIAQAAADGAAECPAGRLTARTKDGELVEHTYAPEIILVEDPERACSGGLYVRGGIQVVGADGEPYEVRNRYVLCRCGRSAIKPFCDAKHVTGEYHDGL